MRIYLAGPMRGLPQFNFPAFDAGAEHLENLGHMVFSPAERDRTKGFRTEHLTGHENLAELGFDLRDALAADTWWISKKADAVALLPGWQKSSGVAAEIALAHALGLPVGDVADFGKDGPHTTLEAPHKPSGTIFPKGKADGGMIPKLGDGETILEKVCRGSMSANAAREALGLSSASYVAPRVVAPAGTEPKPPANGEVRTTSTTGGEKGTKPERYDLIPVGALAKVAALYGRGAAKYAAHNWRKGYEWSKSYAALQRHATQFWNGEDNDAEMDLPHMASVAFHALALLTFMEEQRGFDDRYQVAE